MKHDLSHALNVCLHLIRQAVAKGAPAAFATAVPDLLAFVRGPAVRGKKDRLASWLESKLEGAHSWRESCQEKPHVRMAYRASLLRTLFACCYLFCCATHSSSVLRYTAGIGRGILVPFSR